MTAQEARRRADEYSRKSYYALMESIERLSSVGIYEVTWGRILTDEDKCRLIVNGYRLKYDIMGNIEISWE